MINASPSETGVPDVSVIMPTWNAEAFLTSTVESVLASQNVELELIIVDDASSDGTFDLLKRLAKTDARIRIDRFKRNGGPSAARNRALQLASGRYIAVVDSDDRIASNRLKKLVDLADATASDIVVDNMLEFDAAGERLGQTGFLKSRAFAKPRALTLTDYVRYNHPMKPGDCLGYLKPLFRKETLNRLNTRYDEALRNSEDYYLVAHLLAQGAVLTYTPYTGYFYRRAEGSTSHRLKPSHTAAWLTAEDDFHSRYVKNLGAPARRQLKARARQLKHVDQMVRAIDSIQRHRFGELVNILRTDPRASLFTLSNFAKIAWQKVSRAVPRSIGDRPARV